MANRRLVSRFSTMVLAMVVAVFLSASAGAGPPTKKRVKKGSATPQKARATHDKQTYVRPAHPAKTYVRTSRDYGHVRLARPHRHDDGSIIVRPVIARSARVRPVVLHRFEDRRRSQIQLVIEHFHSGDHASAIRLWGSFVAGLVDYHEPIDLDDVMLLIARESFLKDNATFLFQTAKLEFLRESEEHFEDYLVQLHRLENTCRLAGRPCPSTTVRAMNSEQIRVKAELDMLRIKKHIAKDDLENIMGSSADHERRFAVAYEDMYREVELRIRFSK